MRFRWSPVLIALACFVAPARAEPFATPAEAAPSASVPAAASDPAAPGQPAQSQPAQSQPAQDRPAPGKRPWVRTGKPRGPEIVELPVAVGVSSPLGWPGGSFGASLYVGFGHHFAVRGNLAWYQSSVTFLEDLASATSGGEVPSYSGSLRDAGLAWIWYPRSLWNGFMFEAGVLQRDRDTGYRPEIEDEIKTKSTTYAGRAMVGWSWLIGRHVFVAVAMGVSAGKETGHETIIPDNPQKMSTTRPVERTQVDAEAYLRIGLALGR